MRRLLILFVIVAPLLVAGPIGAQTAKAPVKKAPARTAPAPAKPVTVRPEMTCPAMLGVGVATQREFCDVLVGRDPNAGIVIKVPLHKGPAVLTFDLHNRETYSEQQERDKRAYARHAAVIGVLTMDGGLLTRAAVDTEFRTAKDLLDRVGGGAGPAGVKAVAPVGAEAVRVEIPQDVDAVSVLGEKLTAMTVNGTEVLTAPGRPIAIISNVLIEYRPAPPSRKVPPKKVPPKVPPKKK
jgi:hypothetical protein